MNEKKFEYKTSQKLRIRIEKPVIDFHDTSKAVIEKIAQLSGIKVNKSDETTTIWVTVTTEDLEMTFFGDSNENVEPNNP